MNKHLGESQKIIKRLKELAKLIDKHNHHYHNEDKPKINDAEYDKLVRENLELELNTDNLNRVVFMGNSITEGWVMMHPEFFKNKEYINWSIIGNSQPNKSPAYDIFFSGQKSSTKKANNGLEGQHHRRRRRSSYRKSSAFQS